MNIFIFHPDLDKSAEFFYKVDKRRFNKQVVESMQLFAAANKVLFDLQTPKADGTPYTVDRILNHPACKWVSRDYITYLWHLRYLKSLLKLVPNHSCNKSFDSVMPRINEIFFGVLEDREDPPDRLCLVNSDMSSLPENASVYDKYTIHLSNKHQSDKKEINEKIDAVKRILDLCKEMFLEISKEQTP